jgi:hypothetical protein
VAEGLLQVLVPLVGVSNAGRRAEVDLGLELLTGALGAAGPATARFPSLVAAVGGDLSLALIQVRRRGGGRHRAVGPRARSQRGKGRSFTHPTTAAAARSRVVFLCTCIMRRTESIELLSRRACTCLGTATQ